MLNSVEAKNTKSKLLTSVAFPEIMAKYEICGRELSMANFWRKYVHKLDPTITYRIWQHYANKLESGIVKKAKALIATFEDNRVTEAMLEESSLKKMLFIGDSALQELIEKPEELAKIPLKDRLKWVFNSMKARDSRMSVLIKKKGEERKQTVTEELLKAAQYGAIEAEDLTGLEPAPAKISDYNDEEDEEFDEEAKEIINREPVQIAFSPDKEFANAEEGKEL